MERMVGCAYLTTQKPNQREELEMGLKKATEYLIREYPRPNRQEIEERVRETVCCDCPANAGPNPCQLTYECDSFAEAVEGWERE